jgi:hypothetical protein
LRARRMARKASKWILLACHGAHCPKETPASRGLDLVRVIVRYCEMIIAELLTSVSALLGRNGRMSWEL